MRNTLLATAAATLLLGGPAWTQQSPATGGTAAQPVTPQMPGTAGGATMDGTAQSSPDSYRAYSELGDDSRDNISFDGDWEADELRDASIVDKDGDEVGEVEDLLVGSDGRVEKILVDMSEVTDKDDHYLPVELGDLKRAEGGDSDELVLDKSSDEIKSEFENETAFEKQDERWMPTSS